MTMMQKVQAKKSKKGFTLVELVIVIAILAILAAIAIPVITTTINSSKISVMESDTATLNMLVKEAINTSKASISTTTYNGAYFDKPNGKTVKIEDLCKENNLGQSGTYVVKDNSFFERKIGGSDATHTYKMVFSTGKNVEVSGGGKKVSGTDIKKDLDISTLDPE